MRNLTKFRTIEGDGGGGSRVRGGDNNDSRYGERIRNNTRSRLSYHGSTAAGQN